MHYTKRLLDRRLSPAVFFSSYVAIGAVAASCSSGDGGRAGSEPMDAAAEASPAPRDDAAVDARPPADAGPFDAAPLPIVCGSPPCATALVTTLGVETVDRGEEGFCALLHDGTVACWGAGGAGQLGRGNTQDSVTPARVVGLSEVAVLDHTCALDKSGAAYCWGTGPYLQNDAAATTKELVPVKLPIPPATNIATGMSAACAAFENGIHCWGFNASGQIAELDNASSLTAFPPRAMAVPPGAPVRDLVVAEAAFVVREDGVTLSWGAGPLIGRVSSLFPDPYPGPLALGGISSLDVANDNACAVAGAIGYCWGAVVSDPAGIPVSKTDRALPEAVMTPEPIVQIATTRTLRAPVNDVFEDQYGRPILQPPRWCATAASGDVYCWGYNASGQAGDGTKSYAYKAVKVVGLPGPAAQVKTTPGTTCALLTTGKVHCWGSNYYGQLGSGQPKVSSLAPREVVLP